MAGIGLLYFGRLSCTKQGRADGTAMILFPEGSKPYDPYILLIFSLVSYQVLPLYWESVKQSRWNLSWWQEGDGFRNIHPSNFHWKPLNLGSPFYFLQPLLSVSCSNYFFLYRNKSFILSVCKNQSWNSFPHATSVLNTHFARSLRFFIVSLWLLLLSVSKLSQYLHPWV